MYYRALCCTAQLQVAYCITMLFCIVESETKVIHSYIHKFSYRFYAPGELLFVTFWQVIHHFLGVITLLGTKQFPDFDAMMDHRDLRNTFSNNIYFN